MPPRPLRSSGLQQAQSNRLPTQFQFRAFHDNYRVANLDALLAQLRREGVQVDDKVEESEFGRFGWIMDPESNRVELGEPPK